MLQEVFITINSMKVLNNKFIPFGKGFLAVNLFGVIFTKGPLDPVDRNHEYIHTLQQREMLFIGFYIVYLIEWAIRIIQYRGYVRGYEHISFEREAYINEYNLSYSKQRKPFAWMKYLRNK